MEILQWIGNNGIIILCLVFFWCVFTSVINLILAITGLWEKGKITYKIKFRKKDIDKVDPIYKIIQYSFSNDYYIVKYKREWIEREGVLFLLFLLIPFHIELLYFDYSNQGGIKVCKKENLVEFFKTNDMIEFYETEYKKEINQNNQHMLRDKKINDTIEALNKTFNENYNS